MPLTNEKLEHKRQTLIERTSRALKNTPDEARELLTIGRVQSVRINTLAAPLDQTMTELYELDVTLAQSPLMQTGMSIEDGRIAIRDSVLAQSGKVYIQNAASWLPVLALDPKPGDYILDMCAAPGGKTSHIAQCADNNATIVANDNSRPRLHKLQSNLERLHVKNVSYTLHDATRLSHQLESASFDKILLDAPCSGEGMMTLDDKKGFESWSVAHIKRLQKLQKKLIVQAWTLLKPGGTLVYSTCTMAPEENEAVLDYLLRHNDDSTIEPLHELAQHLENMVDPVLEWNGKLFDERLVQALRLKPSPQVEAFFVVKITKGYDQGQNLLHKRDTVY